MKKRRLPKDEFDRKLWDEQTIQPERLKKPVRRHFTYEQLRQFMTRSIFPFIRAGSPDDHSH